MYDFDVYEAVDDLIDEINESYIESSEEAYQQVYEELCERVECEELTLEEAELINEAAAEKYLYENCEKSSEDDDKENGSSEKGGKPKKKINKKKVAAGVAAGLTAGLISNRAIKKYKCNARNSRKAYDNICNEIHDLRKVKKDSLKDWDADPSTKKIIEKEFNAQLKDYNKIRKEIKDKANLRGKKLIKYDIRHVKRI